MVAEWSKALALGASPKGRGFEPHPYHDFLLSSSFDKWDKAKCAGALLKVI